MLLALFTTSHGQPAVAFLWGRRTCPFGWPDPVPALDYEHYKSYLGIFKGNYKRFAWEVAAILLSIVVTWLIGHFSGQGELKACQDERTILLQEKASAQTVLDSIKWSKVINLKETQINSLQHENNRLREKAALDSAANHSELEAMRSINKRYKAK
ncbi:hypothetical protein [Spirosoma foliorum]|uniref:Uncharacterized protein n=1 Tax=Spirosoma foliorum TaxID=2710596 RepID=A0A7G5GYW6_9BACT|nr:hypothetical protein [Spirosoma foliorum]QMW04058.1 hypothetical protein H3H32_03625 [Spirosoma foliorum]